MLLNDFKDLKNANIYSIDLGDIISINLQSFILLLLLLLLLLLVLLILGDKNLKRGDHESFTPLI